jgi:tryptophan-rich sensory protein
LAYIVVSWRVDTWASLMMVPYFAWVSFASLLNYNYWILNT